MSNSRMALKHVMARLHFLQSLVFNVDFVVNTSVMKEVDESIEFVYHHAAYLERQGKTVAVLLKALQCYRELNRRHRRYLFDNFQYTYYDTKALPSAPRPVSGRLSDLVRFIRDVGEQDMAALDEATVDEVERGMNAIKVQASDMADRTKAERLMRYVEDRVRIIRNRYAMQQSSLALEGGGVPGMSEMEDGDGLPMNLDLADEPVSAAPMRNGFHRPASDAPARKMTMPVASDRPLPELSRNTKVFKLDKLLKNAESATHELHVGEDHLRVVNKGRLAAGNPGQCCETFDFNAITNIEFKSAGLLTKGFIKFHADRNGDVNGLNGDATKSARITFTKAQQTAFMDAIKFIQTKASVKLDFLN